MSAVDYHASLAQALWDPRCATVVVLEPTQARRLLGEWDDAQAMIRALQEMVEQLQGAAPQPPAWTVIA